MRAWRVHPRGTSLEETSRSPWCDAGQLRVRVEAFAIGATEWASARRHPEAAGADGAGVVLESPVAWPQAGDAVVFPALAALHGASSLRPVDPGAGYGVALERARGTWAEEVFVPAHRLLALPAGFSAAEGAAALCFPRVVESMRPLGLRPGMWLAVFDAARDEGPLAIQWGRAQGCLVIAIARSVDHQSALRELGAHEVLCEPHENIPLRLAQLTAKHGVEAVVGCADDLAELSSADHPWLAPGARWWCTASPTDATQADAMQPWLQDGRSSHSSTTPGFERSAQILEWLAAGRFEAPLHRSLGVDDSARALRRMLDPARLGRVVIHTV